MNKRKLDFINSISGILFVIIFLENAFISLLYFDHVKMMLFERSESIFYCEKGDFYWWIAITSLEWFLTYAYVWGKLINRKLELFGYFQTCKSQKLTMGNLVIFSYRKDRKRNINYFLLYRLTEKKVYDTFNKFFWYSQMVILPLAVFFFVVHINVTNTGIEVQSVRHILLKTYDWHDISEVIIYEKHLQTEMQTDVIYYSLFTNDHTSVNLLSYVDSYQEVKIINQKLIEHHVPIIFQSYDKDVVLREAMQLGSDDKKALYDIFLKKEN